VDTAEHLVENERLREREKMEKEKWIRGESEKERLAMRTASGQSRKRMACH
jgi:hypothetical protein